VSLIVVPPGLTLSGTPVSVVAGATGTSTLTITPTNGFSGTVTLKCNGGSSQGGANDVPTCLSIPPVTISGNAPATTTLSIQTQPGTTPAQYLESVNAVDSSGVAMANTTVAVTVTAAAPPPPPSFALTNATVSIATPGASGTSTITISPSGGFTGSVALSCTVTGPTNAIDLPTCSIPAPPAIKGTAAVTATLTVNTTAASSSSNATGQAGTAFRNQHNRMLALGGGGALVAFLFFGVPSRRRPTKTLLSLLLLGAFTPIVMGCGGAQKAANPVTTPNNPVMTPANPGTTVGSYMVTVTGSSGTLTASTTVAVTVN
jgi:trimeric autotransporter adhesin